MQVSVGGKQYEIGPMNSLKKFREAAGLSQQELGDAVGLSRQQIYRLETGKNEIKQALAKNLAEVLRIPWKSLILTEDELDIGQIAATIERIPVLGSVQAGAWIEVNPMQDTEEIEYIPVVPDQRYSHARQFALRVAGTSMNRVFPPGQFAVCVDVLESGIQPKNNDIVVVVRRKNGLLETTLKRLKVAPDGSAMLVPESDDPAHQSPVILSIGTEEIEVEVTALVTGRFELM